MFQQITTSANQITGTFNELNFMAQLNQAQPGKFKKIVIVLDQCIVALYENEKPEIKPYPNWKHSVNQILTHLRVIINTPKN